MLHTIHKYIFFQEIPINYFLKSSLKIYVTKFQTSEAQKLATFITYFSSTMIKDSSLSLSPAESCIDSIISNAD